MRFRTLAALVSLSLPLPLAAACGGRSEPPHTADNAQVSSAATDAGAAPAPETAPSATTTTTMTLGDGGDLQGTKLTTSSTSQSSGTIASAPADAGAGPHAPEPGRSVKDIQTIILAHRDEARACYDKALKDHPGIEGNIDVAWTIDPTGNVSEIHVDEGKSDIHEPSVGKCIIDVIQKIHFAVSGKGFETRAHYPFNFHPRGNSRGGPQH